MISERDLATALLALRTSALASCADLDPEVGHCACDEALLDFVAVFDPGLAAALETARRGFWYARRGFWYE